MLLTWALPLWQPTGEEITAGDAVKAVLPGDWAPEAIRPLLHAAAVMAALFAAAGLLLERRMARPLPWAGLAAAVIFGLPPALRAWRLKIVEALAGH